MPLHCGVLVLELANLVHKLKIFGIYPWKASLSSHLYLRNSQNYYQTAPYCCIYHFPLVLSEQKKVEACDGTIFGRCASPAAMFMMTMWKPINTYPIFSNCWFYDHFVSTRTPLNIFQKVIDFWKMEVVKRWSDWHFFGPWWKKWRPCFFENFFPKIDGRPNHLQMF